MPDVKITHFFISSLSNSNKRTSEEVNIIAVFPLSFSILSFAHSCNTSSAMDPSTEADNVAAPVAACDPSPRRSGRERVSTTMQIDGHTVLRSNNYTVTGDSYIFGAHKEDDAAGKPPAPKKPRVQQQPKQKPVPRQPTAAQVARANHNDAVVAATRPKEALRFRFLAEHLPLLEPFLEPSVLQTLREARQGIDDDVGGTKRPAAVAPPKMIRATLRDYQLRGLDFMVRMHRQNLAMILGDEMGLVRRSKALCRSSCCRLSTSEKRTCRLPAILTLTPLNFFLNL